MADDHSSNSARDLTSLGANKRRRTSGDDCEGAGDDGPRKNAPGSGCQNNARGGDSIGRDDAGPIIFLNVGGAKRNVRRSLLGALRDASATDRGVGNPLCDVLLSAHWSGIPTAVDADGTVRVYVDRNPSAFDDLLEYIEYGKIFLDEIVANEKTDGGDKSESARLKRLRLEADYFTVGTLSDDIDAAMFGSPMSFSSGDWVTAAGKCSRNQAGEAVGWSWSNFWGNQSLAADVQDEPLPILEVKSAGKYLVFFSLHSVATKALLPSHGYPSDNEDEFCRLHVFRDKLTSSEGAHWVYPLVRCGAFDYREDQERRQRQPLLFTAACAEPVSLREGNQLYTEHGVGQPNPSQRVTNTVSSHTRFADDPHCVCYITLVRASGGSIAKWNVKRNTEEDEPTVVNWLSCNNDFPAPSCASLDRTKIPFQAAGFYLILGRVASCLKKDYNSDEKPVVQLEVYTKGGNPLHVIPEVVTFSDDDQEKYNSKLVEYGPINDIIYAEKGSYACVTALHGACFAEHGSVPGLFGKIPTQSVSVMRLKPSSRIDRYQILVPGIPLIISDSSDKLRFERALGGDKRTLEQQSALFAIEGEGDENNFILRALLDCQCIVVGVLSSVAGSIVSLLKNDAGIIYSQLCGGSGRGSHSFSGVIDLKKDDHITLTSRVQDCANDGYRHGHLAFVVLES